MHTNQMVLAFFSVSTTVLRRETGRFEVTSVGLVWGAGVFRSSGWIILGGSRVLGFPCSDSGSSL
jgi:hypothetical protein